MIPGGILISMSYNHHKSEEGVAKGARHMERGGENIATPRFLALATVIIRGGFLDSPCVSIARCEPQPLLVMETPHTIPILNQF